MTVRSLEHVVKAVPPSHHVENEKSYAVHLRSIGAVLIGRVLLASTTGGILVVGDSLRRCARESRDLS